VLETLRQYTKRKDFNSCHCLLRRAAIGENARQLRHLGQPATIFFAFVFNREIYVAPRQVGPNSTPFGILATERVGVTGASWSRVSAWTPGLGC
jgi:hypothetical protein